MTQMRSALFLSGNVTNLSVTNSSFEVDEMGIMGSRSMTILLLLLICFLILVTVMGNSLVIVAFIEDKRLRNRSNFFLLNLAICDFFIGVFCIPLYVPYLFTGKWMLGKFLCKLWLITDNLMCTASAFNVVLISYDRFLAVTMAVTYRSQQQQHCQTVLKMIAVWILSSLLYSPAILFWEYLYSDNSVPENLCLPAYYYSWHFLLGASTLDFILPLLSISSLNLSIYWNIKRRSRKKGKSTITSIYSNQKEMSQMPYIISGELVHCAQNDLRVTKNNMVKKAFHQRLKQRSSEKTNLTDLQSCQTQRSNIRIVKLSQDKKMAKSLSVLVCVFGICWAPYSLLMTTRAACHDYCIASYWYEITFWLLWINSSINPILYPLCHESFRRAFIKVTKICTVSSSSSCCAWETQLATAQSNDLVATVAAEGAMSDMGNLGTSGDCTDVTLRKSHNPSPPVSTISEDSSDSGHRPRKLIKLLETQLMGKHTRKPSLALGSDTNSRVGQLGQIENLALTYGIRPSMRDKIKWGTYVDIFALTDNDRKNLTAAGKRNGIGEDRYHSFPDG
ncbi:histamine H3 receptor-like [Mixophyes fleayi]|uniref:histamine H3 receptor-like n=1 Tax=Mixophyes fleayi TaxID=3061075 RepID=UPI003F4D8147